MFSNDPAAEKVYQFISDPAHKETLSGRVRTACITCRRKKIRCSGNSPCTTCTEKGIACEGLTPRRRPKRSHDLQRYRGPLPVEGDVVSQLAQRLSHTMGPSHTAEGGTLDRNPVRPTADLLKLRTESGDDSGYGSNSSVRNDATSMMAPIVIDDSKLRQSRLPIYEGSTPVSPSTYPDWSFQDAYGSHDYGAGASAGRAVCSSMSAPTTTHLIWAAKALEEQAKALRHLATEPRPQAVEEARHQTIALPLRSDCFLPSSCPQLYQQNAHDDLPLPWGFQVPALGFSPSAAECNSCWDISSTSPTTYGFQDMQVDSMSTDLASAASTTLGRGVGSNPNPTMYDDNIDNSLMGRQRPLSSNVCRLHDWVRCDQR